VIISPIAANKFLRRAVTNGRSATQDNVSHEAVRRIEISTEAEPVTAIPGGGNKRSSKRYTLGLALRCRPIESQFRLARILIGESLNISSKGLVFKTTETFAPGQVVEAFIDWPVLLDHCVRLTLFVEGVVVRSAGNQTAMRIEKYEFRTRGARPDGPIA
jgi:hypothetical protein